MAQLAADRLLLPLPAHRTSPGRASEPGSEGVFAPSKAQTERKPKAHVKENSEKVETLRRSPAGRNPARQSMEPCSRKRVMRSQSRGWHEALTVSTEAAGLSHESTNAGVFAVYPAGTEREATRMASRRPSLPGSETVAKVHEKGAL